MTTKHLHDVEVKNVDKGQVTAVFSRFNVVDHDGDVTLPGAFADGTPVRISAYMHGSWQGALPVGKGIVRTTDTEAVLDGQFFLNTQAGRDTFTVVKELGSLQEWSYSVEPAKHSFGEFEGRRVRFLEKLSGPHEVSPVLQGAGIGTRTLEVKQKSPGGGSVAQFKAAIRPHETEVVNRSWDGPAVVAAIGDDVTVDGLRSVFAWVDSGGDPEAKSSYRFPHHHGVGGGANLRACLAGIAALNGARGGTSIPDADRKGVYDHLAAHLRDADREPPELRARDGVVKLNDRALGVLADLSDLVGEVAEVGASRALKGKGLTRANAEILGWVSDELRRLQSVLNPSDELAHEFVRAVALMNGGVE